MCKKSKKNVKYSVCLCMYVLYIIFNSNPPHINDDYIFHILDHHNHHEDDFHIENHYIYDLGGSFR